MKMKSLLIVLISICLIAGTVSAQFKTPKVKVPDASKAKAAAAAAAKTAAGSLSGAAKGQFMKVAKDIPFAEASARLKLNDPNYKIQGYSVDDFMKQVFIPAMSKIVNTLPAGTSVIIKGHASSTGSEDATGNFIGNQKLSEKRANAVLSYLVTHSKLSKSKFKIESKGSSDGVAGRDSADPINRRVSFDLR